MQQKIFFYAYIIWLINEFVLLYNVIFLLTLILVFTQKESDAMVNDRMLKRGTPKLVCAQNQNLFKKTFKSEFENYEIKRQGLKALAEINEYMFN